MTTGEVCIMCFGFGPTITITELRVYIIYYLMHIPHKNICICVNYVPFCRCHCAQH